MKQEGTKQWDPKYEWKAVAQMSIGFGLVGVDRFMIMPLFPTMMKDLNLDYQDLGHISAILALTWAISAVFMGNWSDRVGRRNVLVPALLVFSLLVGLSGLATGVGSLLLVRGLMGFAEGAYTPVAITATVEASKPSRHGLNVGIQQAMMPALGLGVAPILVTQLLRFVDWRWVFVMVSVPGFVLAYVVWKVLRDQSPSALAVHTATHDATQHKWTEVFRYRNVPISMVGMLGWLTCLMVTSALMPNYLTDYRHLDVQTMGFVLSAVGFGAALGTVIMPAISDRAGRKPVMLISVLGAIAFLVLLISAEPERHKLFGYLFMVHFFNFGCICLTVGPISSESVPARLMSTASGVVIAVGELVGGAGAPALAGYIAKNFGIQYILYLALGGLAIGFLVMLGLRETAPCKTDLARR